jgi:hypothetical protein
VEVFWKTLSRVRDSATFLETIRRAEYNGHVLENPKQSREQSYLTVKP